MMMIVRHRMYLKTILQYMFVGWKIYLNTRLCAIQFSFWPQAKGGHEVTSFSNKTITTFQV